MANTKADMIMSMTTMMYCVSEKFTLMLNIPVRLQSKTTNSVTDAENSVTGAENDLSGMNDIKIMSKFRMERDYVFGIGFKVRF
jgi:hypothetical protein